MVKTSKQLVNTLKLIRPEDQLLLYWPGRVLTRPQWSRSGFYFEGRSTGILLSARHMGMGLSRYCVTISVVFARKPFPETVRGQLQRFAQVLLSRTSL